MRVNFFFICAIGLLNTCNRASLENVPLFHQFLNAFRVRILDPGQPL